MRKDQIRNSIAIDVGHHPALGVIAVGDHVLLPLRARLLRILVPPDSVRLPACRHHIRRAIVIHIDRPLAAVGDKLAQRAGLAILMPLPLAAIRARILIPVSAAQNIGIAVAIHVQRGHAFRMIRSQAMREKRNLRHRHPVRRRRGLLFRLCGGPTRQRITTRTARNAKRTLSVMEGPFDCMNWLLASEFCKPQFRNRCHRKTRDSRNVPQVCMNSRTAL